MGFVLKILAVGQAVYHCEMIENQAIISQKIGITRCPFFVRHQVLSYYYDEIEIIVSIA